MMRTMVAVAVLFVSSPAAVHAQEPFLFFMGDRVEYVEHEGSWLWDMQGWYGNDEYKLWLKTEGEHDDGDTAEADLQLLYGRPVSAYWDLQLGLRHDIEPSNGGIYAVIGLQGLAPQWFEIDVAAFIHEDGDVTARFEAEYDLLLTQRWILQPRMEFDSGHESIAFGLRLRYEIRREFAPYIGLSWQDTDGQEDFLSLVAGARFWF